MVILLLKHKQIKWKKPSSGLSLSILAFQPPQVWRWLMGAPQTPISLSHEQSQRKDVPLDSLALPLIFPIWKISLNAFCCVLFITIPDTSWLYLLEFWRQVHCHCVCGVMSTGLTSVEPWVLSTGAVQTDSKETDFFSNVFTLSLSKFYYSS